MFAGRVSFTLSLAILFAINLALALPAVGQDVLYNNGPDGNAGYYHVNFGALASNSFTLPSSATLSYANLTIYAVDDGNPPVRLKWTITTEPSGCCARMRRNNLVASGASELLLRRCG